MKMLKPAKILAFLLVTSVSYIRAHYGGSGVTSGYQDAHHGRQSEVRHYQLSWLTWVPQRYRSYIRSYLQPTPSAPLTTSPYIPSMSWSTWTAWSQCTVTCGEGVHSRARQCLTRHLARQGCYGPSIESKSCSKDYC
ncbi:uncharacterized protein [Watersipora subatra]|uniref:uncharacterized protein n=1 Tax=Watersipora subatra TaxID=2589382 RepID=UPI00355ADC4E